ncbi:MAG TPA: DUF1573 domain-containing protein [Flavisolibacter sp.]|nr:DUF1573 domain-containing protein [Flavisolibacter sp.]
MKYLAVLFSGILIWSCSNTDQKTASADQATQDSLAQIALSDTTNFSELQWIDSTSQDLGKLTEGQVVDITWRFKNAGTKPLVVTNVMAGCGCTVAEKPEAPLAPGEEGVIKAKFNSQNQVGMQNKSVTVQANTSENVYHLSFKAEVSKK